MTEGTALYKPGLTRGAKSSMVCFEISANGKSLSKACVGETDQFEVALAKPIGDQDTTLSVTVFAARSRYHNKIYRIIEDNEGIEPYMKSNEDREEEKESATFCSLCGKGDGEVGSMIRVKKVCL